MNDRIAIILYGQIRNFPFVWRNWKYNDGSFVDFYISTWTQSFESHTAWIVWDEQDLKWRAVKGLTNQDTIASEHRLTLSCDVDDPEGNTFNEFLKEYPDTKLFLNDFETVPTWNKKDTSPSMFFHWKTGLESIKSNSRPYEAICLLRLDSLHLFNQKNILENIRNNPNTIFTPTPEEHYKNGIDDGEKFFPPKFLNDSGIYGDYDTMCRWIEGLDYKKHREPHIGIGEWTTEGKFNHKFDRTNCRSAIIRLCEVQYMQMMDVILEKRGITKRNDITNYYEKCRFKRIFDPIINAVVYEKGEEINFETLVYKPNDPLDLPVKIKKSSI